MMTRFFEDYPVGLSDKFGPIDIEQDEMIAFAKQWDPQPFHIDADAARSSIYGEIIASGWYTCAIAMRELVNHFLSPASSLGSPGLDTLRWLAPVHAGDRLWLRCEVIEARASRSKPDRGILKTRIELLPDGGDPVLSMVAGNFVLRRGRH
ncbi:MaoC family dehydratase [Ferrimicrobium sp.]|jgi:acyl dehydratase|uniref:MaoC family dehydratase n=1 Tax=Ferrimicrobium sp. TaxID=2926050 RepID=UPI00262130E5|nr:MaoC family dehydratase [Ferrimicrobium sp.]